MTLANLPSSVFWLAGIAGFLGFILGSINPLDPERGVKFDFRGAVLCGVAAACLVGGTALYFNGQSPVALVAIGVGVFLSVVRFVTTRPPRVPHDFAVAPGVNRLQGESLQAKFKAAEYMFDKASFSNNHSYFATRSPILWRFKNGMQPADVKLLAECVPDASSNTLDILLLLVRELPGAPGEAAEPAVIAICGAHNLRAMQFNDNRITIPACGITIEGSAIVRSVGYAWR